MTKDDVFPDKYFVPHHKTCAGNTARWAYYGAVTGVCFSGIMSLHADRRLSYLEIAGRHLARVVFPWTITAMAFGATTSMMDDIRGKDKQFSNAFIGGAVAGLVLGCVKHSPTLAMRHAVVFGTLGALARFLSMNCMYVYDPKAELERLNESLYMSNLEHLKPASMK